MIGSTDLNILTYTDNGVTGTEDVQYKIRAQSNRGDGAFSIRATFILASKPTTTTPIEILASQT